MAKKQLIGIVKSAKMQQTVVVMIERKVQHPLYKKMIRINKAFKADTNGLTSKAGDRVKIEQISPMSKGKTFKVIEIVTEGDVAVKKVLKGGKK